MAPKNLIPYHLREGSITVEFIHRDDAIVLIL